MRGLACFLVVAALGCQSEPPCPAGTFTQMRSCVFKTSCTLSMSCHGNGGAMGALDLETDPYTALMQPPDPVGAAKRGWNVPPSWKRVTPGDETTSFLWIKLAAPFDQNGKVLQKQYGDHMPDTSGQALDEGTLVQILDWIRAGAPND